MSSSALYCKFLASPDKILPLPPLTPLSSAGLVEVIIYSSPDDKKKNRGFCFLEYESHKAASLAKRLVIGAPTTFFQARISLQEAWDWAYQGLELWHHSRLGWPSGSGLGEVKLNFSFALTLGGAWRGHDVQGEGAVLQEPHRLCHWGELEGDLWEV